MMRTLIAVVAALAATFEAQAAGAVDEGRFLLAGHFQLRVNGKVEPDARLFWGGQGVPRLLVVTPALSRPVMIIAGEKRVVALAPADIVADPSDPEAALVRRSGTDAGPSLEIDGAKLKFTLGAARAAVEPRDPLLGDATPERLLAYMPEYRRNAAAYAPQIGAMRMLESLPGKAEVVVYFGTWCPHCEHFVPRLLKVAQSLHGKGIVFRFHGVPGTAGFDDDAKRANVQAVPVAIVRRDGQVLGRIEGEKWEQPEVALGGILLGY